MDMNVTIRGPLFDKLITKEVEDAIIDETLTKIDERIVRPGRWQQRIGAKRNIVSRRRNGLSLHVDTTRNWPRTTGSSWVKTNLGIIRSMAPRVARKTADRIISELS